MKKVILLAAVIFLSTSGLAQGWLFFDEPPGDLGVTMDFTYASRHIWRGFDYFPSNRGAIYTSADIDFWGTGFGANVLWARPIESGYENWEWLVYTLYYYNTAWQDAPRQMDYRFGWRYYNHPDGPMRNSCHPRDLDFQEFYARFAWPAVCPAGFVPYYECAVIWPDEGGRRTDGCPRSFFRQYGGWFHTLGVSRDWAVPAFLPSQPGQVINTSWQVVFNDGAGPTTDSSKNNVDHDWSHCRWGASTEYVISREHSLLTFNPAIYYQSSWDDSVNEDDEIWVHLSVKYKF